MKKHFVLPVIHFLNAELAIEQADLAFCLGADGVFLISHRGQNEELYEPAMKQKEKYPDALIGLNLLGDDPIFALNKVFNLGLDMVWVDAPGVTSSGLSDQAEEITRNLDLMNSERGSPMFFGSVAFKYQAHEAEPGLAAFNAAMSGMIPTTSGVATGSAPDVSKIALMRKSLGDEAWLAIASGMTPENVSLFKPYATHFLVATGVSDDDYRFNEGRLDKFVRAVAG